MNSLWNCPATATGPYGSHCAQGDLGDVEQERCERYCVSPEDVGTFLGDVSTSPASYPMAFTWANRADFVEYVGSRKELVYRHIRGWAVKGDVDGSVNAFNHAIYDQAGFSVAPVEVGVDRYSSREAAAKQFEQGRLAVEEARHTGEPVVIPLTLYELPHAACLIYNPRGFTATNGRTADAVYIDSITSCEVCAPAVDRFIATVVKGVWGIRTIEKISHWVKADYAQSVELGDSGLCYMWMYYLSLPILRHANDPIDEVLEGLRHLTTKYRGIYSLMMGYNIYRTVYHNEVIAAHAELGSWITTNEEILEGWKQRILSERASYGATGLGLALDLRLDKWRPARPGKLAEILAQIHTLLDRPIGTPNLYEDYNALVARSGCFLQARLRSMSETTCGVM